MDAWGRMHDLRRAAAQRAVGLHQDSTLYDENINSATTAARATGVARIAEVGTRPGVEDACVCSSLSQTERSEQQVERGPRADQAQDP